MRTVTSRVINNYKKNGVTFSSFIKEDDDNNNNTEKMELRKPRLFVEQVFEMKKAIPEFDEQSLTDEIDTLIAGVIYKKCFFVELGKNQYFSF